MPDPVFRGLFRATDQLTWASVPDVQRRGRQWARRRALAAAAACLVVVGAVGGGVAAVAGARTSPPPPGSTVGPTTETPPPTPSASVSPTPSTPATSAGSSTPTPAAEPTAITPAAMLQESDLPARFTAAGTDLDGDWSFFSTTIWCNRQVQVDVPAPTAGRGQVFEGQFDERLVEAVDRRSVQAANAYLDAIRAQVATCDPRPDMQQSIVDEGFAGEESFIVSSNVASAESLHIFVRQGGLVAEIWQKGLTDRDEGRRLATRAADRLCEATNTC
jgi:hypothetical protein